METVSYSDFYKHLNTRVGRLSIELTERCNNNCRHCYINKPENDPSREGEIGFDLAARVIDEAAILGAMTVKLSGGEPLLNADFSRIYTHVRKSGLDAVVFTNARLIDKSIAGLFSRLLPKKVEVSVYGITQKSYDAVARKMGAYDEFLRGILLLREHSVPTKLKFVPLKENLDDSPLFPAWCERVFPEAEVLHAPSAAFTPREDDDSSFRRSLQIKERFSPEEVVAARFERADYANDIFRLIRAVKEPKPLFVCSLPRSPLLDSRGVLYPCLLLKSPEFACDMKKMPFGDAITHFENVASTLPVSDEYQKKCAMCFMRSVCDSCPAKAYMERGKIDGVVDYYCEIARLTAIRLGLITSGENTWSVSDAGERIKKLGEEIGNVR